MCIYKYIQVRARTLRRVSIHLDMHAYPHELRRVWFFFFFLSFSFFNDYFFSSMKSKTLKFQLSIFAWGEGSVCPISITTMAKISLTTKGADIRVSIKRRA